MNNRHIAALTVLFVALLFALPMQAQTAPSEQLYLPYVAHLGIYSTDLTLTNLTTDRVSISYRFTPANASDDNPNVPLTRDSGVVRRLDPQQSMTVEIGDLGISGQGSLYINVCKTGALCWETTDPASPDPASPRVLQNFDPNAIRKISVTARIYLIRPDGGTRGDSMTATPWYALPGSDRPGLDRVSIVGIRSDGHYTTQIGLANASEYSATILTAILRDGLGIEHGRWTERLEPLTSAKRSVEQMFPLGFDANRLNRRPPISSPWVEVSQTFVVPNELAAHTEGCENGCPRFDAWASVTDSLSGDFSLVMGSFETVNQSSEVAAAITDLAIRSRSQSRPATSEVWCTVEPVPKTNYYRVTVKKDGSTLMNVTAEEQEEARAMCGAVQATGGNR